MRLRSELPAYLAVAVDSQGNQMLYDLDKVEILV
jgi:hypothetical protein